MVDCVQSTSPEIRARGTPPTRKLSASESARQETFHQKDTVAGPVTTIDKRDTWPVLTRPLCPAATPSWETLVNPCQTALPSVVQINPGALRATGKGTVALTVSNALELVMEPVELVTTTE